MKGEFASAESGVEYPATEDLVTTGSRVPGNGRLGENRMMSARQELDGEGSMRTR